MITVNLTAMLVLTTIFIDVSNNLPKTSYIKMVDVWLLFNLLQPFFVVLMHTYMDTLREDNEEEHKKSKEGTKEGEKLKMVRKFALIYNPSVVVAFAGIYWIVGLSHAGII